MKEVKNKPVKIVETVLRDAHQSLIATRMTTEEMLPIVPKMDEIGYHAVECWGGATFDACLRFQGRPVGPFEEAPGRLQEDQAPDALPRTEHPGLQPLRR